MSGNNSGAFGDPSTITGTGSYSVGNNNNISGNNSFVLGSNVTAGANNTVSLGVDSSATQAGGVALGANSTATRAAQSAGTTTVYSSGTLIITSTHSATEQAAVSVGGVGTERQITNVADATEGTDAVTLRQLQGVAQNTGAQITNVDNRVTNLSNVVNVIDNRLTREENIAVHYDTKTNGDINYNSVTLGGGKSTGPVGLHNVADGVAPNDAVNKGQLDGMGKKLHAGIATAIALESAPYIAGKLTSYAGVGYSGGQAALGVSVRKTAENGRWSLSVGVARSNAGTSGRVGVTNIWD